jgi:hypothetical protein
LKERSPPYISALQHYAILHITIIAVTTGVQLFITMFDTLNFHSNALLDSFVEMGVLSLTGGGCDPRGLCGGTDATIFST